MHTTLAIDDDILQEAELIARRRAALTFLLDVNVLIALVDPTHVMHDDANVWFEAEGHRSWATCPMTENGVIRIVGNSRYPNSPGSLAAVAQSVDSLLRLPGHSFWPDDLSLFDKRYVDIDRILTSRQITDTCLLALAEAHGGRLATFDRRLATEAVEDGKTHLLGIAAA